MMMNFKVFPAMWYCDLCGFHRRALNLLTQKCHSGVMECDARAKCIASSESPPEADPEGYHQVSVCLLCGIPIMSCDSMQNSVAVRVAYYNPRFGQ